MSLSRRTFIKSLGLSSALLGSGIGLPKAHAQAIKESAVVNIFLAGGYNSLFGSAGSYQTGNLFGVTATNSTNLGNGLVVDKSFIDGLGTWARTHIATAGIRHGITSHENAQQGFWMGGESQSAVLRLAKAIGGTAAFKAALISSTGALRGNHDELAGVSLQRFLDWRNTIETLTGEGAGDPARVLAIPGLEASGEMSLDLQGKNGASLRSDREARNALATQLRSSPDAAMLNAIPAAYGVTQSRIEMKDNINDALAMTEILIRTGTNVVNISHTDPDDAPNRWDSHGDRNGMRVRAQMAAHITPSLAVFIRRMMENNADYNVTVVISGDFARSLPGSDHAATTAATVIGSGVKVGSTGRMDSSVNLPPSAPGYKGFWSLVASLAKVKDNPFAANPHAALVLQ
jgi:hypothetical protein